MPTEAAVVKSQSCLGDVNGVTYILIADRHSKSSYPLVQQLLAYVVELKANSFSIAVVVAACSN
jgi:hypothetical protein